MNEFIEIRGARENNLKDVSLRILKRRITIFTGVSGSGKSIVFDTIATEAQRRLALHRARSVGDRKLSTDRSRRAIVKRISRRDVRVRKHVQAHTRDDGRQPGSQVLDRADIGAAESNPAFLGSILGFAR